MIPTDSPLWPAGTAFYWADSVASTNVEAAARSVDTAGPFWFAAGEQKAGRGRRGRPWASPPGNLYASHFRRLPDRAPSLASLPLAASLAVFRSIAAVMPARAGDMRLKWPNDILVDGAKINGVLLEQQDRAVIIGCGINCANHPKDAAYPATSLRAKGVDVAPLDLLARLAHEMDVVLRRWMAEGFSAIRAEWLSHARGVGDAIRVNGEHQSLEGVFAGLDDEGYLILQELDGSHRRIAAGDLFFQEMRLNV